MCLNSVEPNYYGILMEYALSFLYLISATLGSL
jgi:hypothetical protein